MGMVSLDNGFLSSLFGENSIDWVCRIHFCRCFVILEVTLVTTLK